MYIRRHAENTVSKLSKMFGAVLVAGPRQVGKTTMLDRITVGFNRATLDDPIIRSTAEEQSGTFFLDNPPPVFIDEIQKVPALFEQIKLYQEKRSILSVRFSTIQNDEGRKRIARRSHRSCHAAWRFDERKTERRL